MFPAFMTAAGIRIVLFGILYSIALAFWPPSSIEPLFDNTMVKYFSVVCVFIGTFFIVLGGPSRVLISSFPLLLVLFLVIWMGTGSAVQLFSNGESLENSFLGRSLVLSMALLGGICAKDPRVRTRISSDTANILGVASVIAIAILLLHSLGLIFQDYRQIYHEEAVLIVAGLAYVCNKRKSLIFSGLVLAFILLIGVLTGKSTMILLGLVFFSINFGGAIVSRIHELHRRGRLSKAAAKVMVGSMLAPAYLLLLWLTWIIVIARVSKYARDLRIKMWNFRWDQFLESPVYGDLFVGTPLYYEPLLPGRAIPTHNDYLDLLAHGGVIAFSMYLTLVLSVCFGGYGMRLLRTRRETFTTEVIFWIISLCYVVSSLGNPVFSEAYVGVVACFSLGFLSQAAKQPKSAHRRAPGRRGFNAARGAV